MRSYLMALISGALFSVGLTIGGMTQPSKIIAFLDITGNWDPALMFVMLGAVSTYFISFRLIQKHRVAPVLGNQFALPTKQKIDPPLIYGAMLFGVGWGISGLCPGPAITSLFSGSLPIWIFVASMAIGMKMTQWLQPVLAGKLKPV